MICDEADEVVLETEVTNTAALMLYERLGFLRDKRLFRKLFIRLPTHKPNFWGYFLMKWKFIFKLKLRIFFL